MPPEVSKTTSLEEHRKPKRKIPKVVLLIGAGLIAIAIIAVGTMLILSAITPKNEGTTTNDTTSASTESEAAKNAAASMKTANASEMKGETAAAIAEYKKALQYYKDAGDEGSVQAVELKLRYLESLSN